MDRYDATTIEAKWQRVWDDARADHVPSVPFVIGMPVVQPSTAKSPISVTDAPAP